MSRKGRDLYVKVGAGSYVNVVSDSLCQGKGRLVISRKGPAHYVLGYGLAHYDELKMESS